MKQRKSTVFKFALCIALFLVMDVTIGFSQKKNDTMYRKRHSWFVNLNSGLLMYYGDMRVNNIIPVTSPVSEMNVGYGISAGDWITPWFGGQANIMAGDISGQQRTHSPINETPSGNDWINNDPKYFKGNIMEFSLTGKVNLTPIFLNSNRHRLDVILYGGFGVVQFRAISRHMYSDKLINYVGYKDVTDVSNGQPTTPGLALTIPAGVSFDYALSHRINLGIDVSERFTSTDNLDATVGKGTYGSNLDQYGYYALTLAYKFGKPVPKKKSVIIAEKNALDSAQAARILKANEADRAERERKHADSLAEQQRITSEALAAQQKKDMDAHLDSISKQHVTADLTIDGIPENKGPLTEDEKNYIKNIILRYDYAMSSVPDKYVHNLDRLIRILKAHRNCILTITGHGDVTDPEDNNNIITLKRATEVRNYLLKMNVPNAGRLKTADAGSKYPVASNKTAAGREMNRRCTFKLVCP